MADETTPETGAETQDESRAGTEGHGREAATLLSGGEGQESGERGAGDGQKQTDGADGETAAQEVAPPDPEKFNLTMPEGSGYGEAEKTQFVAMARELGLTEKQTQQLVEKSAQARSAGLEAQRAARNKQVEDWNKALREDKEFGGEKFAENVEYFLRGVKHLDASGELETLLEETGYGSHPGVVKAVARIGRQLNNDKLIGRGVTADDTALAERYFKN